MKLAERLAQMSNEQATKEEAVLNKIVNFFAEKFENGEIMKRFEKRISSDILRERTLRTFLQYFSYAAGCLDTHFSFMGFQWSPEDPNSYMYKGTNLNRWYKEVLSRILVIAKQKFEDEGFSFRAYIDPKDHMYETYVVEISW